MEHLKSRLLAHLFYGEVGISFHSKAWKCRHDTTFTGIALTSFGKLVSDIRILQLITSIRKLRKKKYV